MSFAGYAVELSLDPRHAYVDFGTALLEEFKDIRLHLVLPGLLDCNLVLDEANKSLQPMSVNIWKANSFCKRCAQQVG